MNNLSHQINKTSLVSAELPFQILNNLSFPVMVLTIDHQLVFVNKACFDALQLTPAKEGLHSAEDLLQPQLYDLLKKKLRCVIKSRRSNKGKVKLTTAGKTPKYFSVELSFFDWDPEYIMVTLRDISDEIMYRNRVENLRKALESVYPGRIEESILFKRLNEAVMQSANTIVITNLEGDIVFANPRFEETTGYTLQEAYMRNPRLLKSGEQSDKFYSELWETISSGHVWKGEFKNKKKSGEYYWESATITPVKDARGKVMEYLAIKEDITGRKLMEEKLEKTLMDMEVTNWEYKMLNQDLQQEVERRRQVENELKLQRQLLEELNETLENQVMAEVKKNREKDELMLLQSRQAAMGEMIGNIAHQWRQPLNALSLMVYDLTDAFRFGEIDSMYIDKSEADIKAVLSYMSQTIDDFRNFFKPNREMQSFFLFDVVKKSISFIDATLKNSGIKLITDIDHNIVLFGYESEFAQVLLNIINNARDALLYNEVSEPLIRITASASHEMANVSVTDNGGGIDPVIIHKIFDPYFTTKEQGKGTGVGLYMSKTIIERNMKGVIWATNKENGAEFVIRIPLAEAPKSDSP
ncbi:MAG: PAS domain S-box protein [Bacteroidota bacterium]